MALGGSDARQLLMQIVVLLDTRRGLEYHLTLNSEGGDPKIL